jgi:hypothetical protein
MATYSLNGLGGVPFTGYTSTLGSGGANQDATSGVVAFNGITQGDERIAKMLRNGGMSLVMRRSVADSSWCCSWLDCYTDQEANPVAAGQSRWSDPG